MIDLAYLFGLLGSITAATMFFPQVLKSYKTKQTKDLSWFVIVIGMLNGIFWIVYGFFRSDPFIYGTNMVLFTGAFLLMVLKVKYG